MSAGFLRRRRRLRCRFRRTLASESGKKFVWEIYPAVLTLVVAVVLACSLITGLEERLRPVLLTAAQTQTKNAVTAVLERAILAELELQDIRYSDMVQIERGTDGSITAITTDMAQMNRLRSTLMEELLTSVSLMDETAISVPLGSLVDSELLWGRGPTIKVRSFTVGSVAAEFESEFSSAGVNQTLHKIWLSVCVPTTILLPGQQMEVSVKTKLCVAETVIIGKVPSYVQKAFG